jgi:hypothetical protein
MVTNANGAEDFESSWPGKKSIISTILSILKPTFLSLLIKIF